MWPKYQAKARNQGFTLLEVLVALTVFAIVTLLAYRGLDSIATTKQRLDQEMRMWRELELVFERINVDVTQIAPRTWLDTNGKERSSVQGSSSNSGSECQLDVMRFGPDHVPVHIRYQVKAGQFWMDIVPDSTSTQNASTMNTAENRQHTLLLDHIERCELAFMDSKNAWQSFWPKTSLSDMARPRGIRLRIVQTGHGMFERMYYLL
jgi:general secretion pathway protein J